MKCSTKQYPTCWLGCPERNVCPDMTERHCSKCGWTGLETDTGFGHRDFYCPICKVESLDPLQVEREYTEDDIHEMRVERGE